MKTFPIKFNKLSFGLQFYSLRINSYYMQQFLTSDLVTLLISVFLKTFIINEKLQ